MLLLCHPKITHPKITHPKVTPRVAPNKSPHRQNLETRVTGVGCLATAALTAGLSAADRTYSFAHNREYTGGAAAYGAFAMGLGLDAVGAIPGGGATRGLAAGRRLGAEAGAINPREVRFSQDSVGAKFKNGNSIEETAARIRSEDVDPSEFPAIRLVERDGNLHTLDNRRLVTFQKAGVTEIPYVMATPEEAASEAWKFTTKTGGDSILIRGTGEVWRR